MPQNPIPAQAFARTASNAPKSVRSDLNGTVYAATSPGNRWYVNETTGLDTNSGSIVAPFKTLTAAIAAAVANNGDIVFIEGTIHVSATVVFNKAGVSYIGIAAPSDNDRARISQTGSTVFTPLVSVTAQGCSFINIATFYGFNDASAQVCWSEAGGRNYYENCQLLGGGDATAAAQAGCRSLTIAGSGENLFVGCIFGLDTIARATNANATVELLTSTPRNRFDRCTFQMLSSLAGNVHIEVLADGMDRWAVFKDCEFINAVESTAIAIDQVVSANAAAGGAIILHNPCSLGATALAAAGPVYVVGSTPVATTSGIAIKAT